MSDGDPTTLAIRIARPFASEAEFLQHELDALTRTTILLRGAPDRPKGVILRFEVALASGSALLRGEGRVLGYRPATEEVDSGLTLRFTRLDARSKALVDRAAALREARTRAVHESDSARTPSRAPPPIHAPTGPELDPKTEPQLQAAAPSAPSVPIDLSDLEPSPPPPRASPPPLPPAPPLSGVLAVAAPPVATSGVALQASAGPRRDELLDRLRQRAKTLSPTAVEQLLAKANRS